MARRRDSVETRRRYALPPEAEGRYIVVVAPGEGRAEPRTLSLTRERLVFHERHLL